MSVADWAHMAANIGLDAIDLSILFVPDRSPDALHTMRRAIEKAGMRIAMITSYPDFTHPDPQQRQRELEMQQEVMEAAEALGAELVRVTDGQAHPQTGRREGVVWAIEGLTRLVESTRHLRVTPVFENHAKPGAWQYTDFSTQPDIFLEIFHGTADVGLGLNFDTGNAAAFSPDPLGLLEQVIHRVVSVHVADTAVFGELRHVQLGTGITPIPAMFERLVRGGWDGWLCMEENARQGRQGVEIAARYVRQTWQAALVRIHQGHEGHQGKPS